MKPDRILAVPLLLLAASLGCSFSGIGGQSASDSGTVSPSLPDYQAQLVYRFDGTQGGQPAAWEHRYTLRVLDDPATRLMSYAETGLDSDVPQYPSLDGYQGNIRYYRDLDQDICGTSYLPEGYDASSLEEPADLLPIPEKLGQGGAVEDIFGIRSIPYDFTAEELTSDPGTQGSGTVWLAEEGGYIVKYSFSLTAGPDFFEGELNGTMTWEYELQPLDSAAVTAFLADCPMTLPEIPRTADAVIVLETPGSLVYETQVPVREVAEFYTTELAAQGYTPGEAGLLDDDLALLLYTKNDVELAVLVQAGNPARVSVSGEDSARLQAASDEQVSGQATQVAGSPQARVVNALMLLIESESQPSVFDSYRMESHQIIPRLDENGQTASAFENWLDADVQGSNIHFVNRDGPQGNQVTTEAYMMDGTEYLVENGTALEGSGMASLTWIMWPLDPTLVLSVGSMNTVAAGTESFEGRTAEVYRISGNSGQDAGGQLAAFGPAIIQLDGTVWVDQETGALLKAAVVYSANVTDGSGTSRGPLDGLLEISVSQVNATSVNLP